MFDSFQALEIKDEECKELSSVRSKVEEELEELTASLFQEAHKMVHDANMKQHIAEKKLKEAKGEVGGTILFITDFVQSPPPNHTRIYAHHTLVLGRCRERS